MKIGIIGGTGVYDSSFIENTMNHHIHTKYGEISYLKGNRNDKEVFFIERHSSGHKLIPSNVNYKGIISALKELNVDLIISTAAVGGINNCGVGDFVLLSDFMDFTKNRSYSFFDEEGAGVVHVDMTEPYCNEIRNRLINAFNAFNVPVVQKGTYICTEGPRFETPAEINMYKMLGGDVVGMTNVPEVILAREASLCYATIALVTNYAAGISNNSLTHKEVSENMNKMMGTLKKVLGYFLDHIELANWNCTCKNSLNELNSLK
ncbi:S-methyl-5'-thioinosine phosphorylase [Haloimpatiens lingqiaonensis]|uniref:S-methyl-5'-thioinosine phosphorylase n=1 Tax=Haloimpatiens lingqiaonensis TaxID=1380675 RepID=UPI0010FE1E15|nr:S-methyl-5'-thioinosine phosphorylase [Haloimpatiens lingqiaonensis]